LSEDGERTADEGYEREREQHDGRTVEIHGFSLPEGVYSIRGSLRDSSSVFCSNRLDRSWRKRAISADSVQSAMPLSKSQFPIGAMVVRLF
jgi:hypothetical protein